ncbi:hypothetical protein RQP54_09155 [Curvibacter sp. APW13]|uniref:hypothetical protein n=1 Tax=Curvibacter sp. APW13 TaxID=3077236 RepID=UPI0028E0747C|nr:hypothetical protein [Curvibacter sp. APW13]MDT8991029.1 hypothetical protein [Curvibacter sp. APW13]
MNPLHTELVRLYFADPQHALLHDATRSPLLGADGHVRCAVLELARPADWSLLGAVWRGVQTDLDLPAPAIAINGADGYQLWFAWQQPLPAAEVTDWLQALCRRYLGAVPPARLHCWPGKATADDDPAPPLPPTLHPRSGQWSAFIAPDLAAVFADEPWLDRDPGLEAQAHLLGRLEGMKPQDFAKSWQLLQPVPLAPTPGASPAAPHFAAPQPSREGYPTDTPAAFLQAVMQDASAPLGLRVQAAAALLATR